MCAIKREKVFLEKVEITDAGSEGKAIGKADGKVVFVSYAVPGDIVDLEAYPGRKSFLEGKVVKFHHYSELRVEPLCEHFGVCGGCKWQNMDYDQQLFFKQKQVKDNLERIGKLEIPEINPILPSPDIYYYRNKLEYTFSDKRWLTDFSKGISHDEINMNGLGFHVRGMFDRVLDIQNCYLQPSPSNEIRLWVKAYTDRNRLSFYNVRNHTGFLRNLIIRKTLTGELMVIIVFGYDEPETIHGMLSALADDFPSITSLMFVINPKKNDIISDLPVRLFHGLPFMIEEMDGLRFKIGPISFFQTNPAQAMVLLRKVRTLAGFKGDELVFDLYTGTGTIANYVARDAKKVVGMEYIPNAIEDAKENSQINGITNTGFFVGDIAKDLNVSFTDQNGTPDVIITDPPRAGMHPKVVEKLLELAAGKIIYISCNPATQARDVAILAHKYEIREIQPIDMFPHTQHVENVMLLVLKKTSV